MKMRRLDAINIQEKPGTKIVATLGLDALIAYASRDLPTLLKMKWLELSEAQIQIPRPIWETYQRLHQDKSIPAAQLSLEKEVEEKDIVNFQNPLDAAQAAIGEGRASFIVTNDTRLITAANAANRTLGNDVKLATDNFAEKRLGYLITDLNLSLVVRANVLDELYRTGRKASEEACRGPSIYTVEMPLQAAGGQKYTTAVFVRPAGMSPNKYHGEIPVVILPSTPGSEFRLLRATQDTNWQIRLQLPENIGQYAVVSRKTKFHPTFLFLNNETQQPHLTTQNWAKIPTS